MHLSPAFCIAIMIGLVSQLNQLKLSFRDEQKAKAELLHQLEKEKVSEHSTVCMCVGV